MYCRFCGNEIPNNAKFCTSCGADLAVEEPAASVVPTVPAVPAEPAETAPAYPALTEAPSVSAVPVQGAYDPTGTGIIAPQRGMNWFKFIIYFQLWASLLVILITAVKYFTGGYYQGNADLVYSVYPALKVLDVCMGIYSVALGVYIVFTQRALAKFRAKGPKMYYMVYGADIVCVLLYLLIGSIIIGESLFSADIAADLIAPAVMILINIRYFNNRKHLFVNP